MKRSAADTVYGIRNDVAIVALVACIIIIVGLVLRYGYDAYNRRNTV
ncbi:MAG: hypothetical protein ACXADA_23825 [Candidatus Hodarchaeales archaeon]